MSVLREPRQLGRYRLLGTLGSGSMGTVYEAVDTVQGGRVALKRLKQLDPAHVQRFKQEFRLARAVAHPNLVTLYDLVIDDTAAYFTMELVPGVNWLAHAADPGPTTGQRSARIAGALRQLVEAVDAMHGRSVVHLDLKPSNVLVTPEGRVVVLDFGLATAFVDEATSSQATSGLRSTLQYVAPEHFIAGGVFSEASDWYSVGVMLFQALTGRSPSVGRPPEFTTEEIRDASPADATLVQICRQLVRGSPTNRASGASVLDLLRPRSTRRDRTPSAVYRAVAEAAFVGRKGELDALSDALSGVSSSSQSRVIAIEGAPGVGKSTLVRHFLSREDVNVLALSGRCYEREAVAFKAWDGLVDGLSAYLAGLSDGETESLAPERFRELGRLFPGLAELDTHLAPRQAAPESGVESRRRAFRTFKDLLRRLGDRYRLVLWLDDLHWADDDSVNLLASLLAPPGAPAALFLLCLRSSGAEAAASRRVLSAVNAAGGVTVERLALQPLSEDESEDLARRLLRGEATHGAVQRLARESFGSPYLLRALAARALRPGREAGVTLPPTAMGLVLEQMEHLPESGRLLLELVSATGQPVEEAVLLRASELRREADPEDARVQLQRLYARSLLRVTELRGEMAVDVYHDCVRDAVRGALSPAVLAESHRALAVALEGSPSPSWERLATHWYAAGDAHRAFEAAFRAAEQASQAFAFSKAADFYALARDCGVGSPLAVAEKRAAALVYAGRCAEAAGEFLQAAGAAGDEAAAFTFRRLAAEMHLVSGQWAEGLALMDPLLRSLGLMPPARPWIARAEFLYLLARIRLRGLSFVRRDEGACDPLLLRKVDTCLATTNGLVAVDYRRGLLHLLQAASLALRAGEPRRVCHAWGLYLCAESALEGTPIEELDAKWAALRELARSCDSPELELAIETMNAIGMSVAGRFAASARPLERSDASLRGDGRAVTFHFGGRLGFTTNALYFSGDLDAFVRLCFQHRAESQAAGDWLGYSGARLFVSFDSIRRGEPDDAREVIRAALEGWDGFHGMHVWAAHASVSASLYEGDAPRALRELDEVWPHLEAAGTIALRVWGAVFRTLRAMALLGAGRLHDGGGRQIRRLESRLASSPEEWVRALGALVRARRLLREGDVSASAGAHHDAAAGFERQSMALYAACARRRQGELLGDAGTPLIHAADAFMRSHGIVDPERWTRMYAP